MSALNDRQEKFCREYLIDYNATQAAKRSGYSAKTAGSIGERLLKNVEIQKRIEKMKAKDAAKSEITRERIIAEYAKLAFGDVRNVFNEDGSVKPITELDDTTAAMLTGFDMEKKGLLGMDVTKKIKLSDRRAALDSLCKVLGYNAPEKVVNSVHISDKEVVFE